MFSFARFRSSRAASRSASAVLANAVANRLTVSGSPGMSAGTGSSHM
jgi:hypothetical protein